MDASSPSIHQRPTSRILVLDPRDRILMFFGEVGYSLEPDRLPDAAGFWMLPGGGVDPGESHEVAAVRELREETGMVAPGPMPCIARRDYTYFWKGRTIRTLERIYLFRSETETIDTSGWQAGDASWIRDLGWWTHDRLAATGDIVRPPGLVQLAGDVLADRIPATPVELPGHF